MKICAIAMCEVQKDSVLCGSDALMDWDAAVDAADDFMARCVGDFYGIDPADWYGRRAKVEERVCRETSVFKGERKLECHYKAEGLVVATSVQETEVR